MTYRMTAAPRGKKLALEEKWHYANFTNSYVFGIVLRDNPKITEQLIRITVPDPDIDEIEIIDREKTQQVSFLSKMTILDVRVKLKDGRIIMIEMQVAPDQVLVKRLRYYRSECDVKVLKPGHSYGELPDVIQIAFCCFDPFQEGRYVYDFEYRSRFDDHEPMEGNGQRTVLLSASGTHGEISDELKEFLACIAGKEAEGDLVAMIDDTVHRLKYDEVRRTDFMKVEDWINMRLEEAETMGLETGMAKGMAQGMAKGMAKGMAEATAQGIRNLYESLIDLGIDEEKALRKTSEKYDRSIPEIRKIICPDSE